MTSSSTRISIPAVVAFSGVTTAILYLLYFQLASDTPMHSHGVPPQGLLAQTTILRQINKSIAKADAGHAIAYHVAASSEEWAEKRSSNFLTAFYSLVYDRYPNRVWIGDGSAIINFPADLQHADKVPPDSWLHDHHIATVVTLIPDGQNGPQLLIHRVR